MTETEKVKAFAGLSNYNRLRKYEGMHSDCRAGNLEYPKLGYKQASFCDRGVLRQEDSLLQIFFAARSSILAFKHQNCFC